MQILTRSAITISYKKPFITWANNLTPEIPFEENLLGESKTYLAKELFDDAEKQMRKHYKAIFEFELEGVWLDENDWPQKRTFKIFCEWFDYEVSDIVIDLLDKSLYE